MKLKKILFSSTFITIVWIVLLCSIWELEALHIEQIKRTPEKVFPHLMQIFESIADPKIISNDQTSIELVLTNAYATLERAGIGFLIGALSGFILALLMKFSGIIEKIAFPYLMLIQMIPILGMAPIVFAITQDIGVSRIVISGVLTFYPVAANTLAGLKSVSAENENLFRSYSANVFQTYTKLYIPTSIPFLFTGLKISAPLAITASILVDTLQGGVGLGCLLSQSLKGGMSPFVFWQIIFLSAAIGILSLQVMVIAEKIIMSHKVRWNREKNKNLI
ncbi:MAG: ABC transporter permease subunit [Ruminococcus sp.]|jgi:NitT/TauT family transport system permease protein|nr:ABC transporter permease subunit [Ruminococcus sp.]